MTALPATPGTAVKSYHPASRAALASGGTGSDRPSTPAVPPGPLSVMRSAARPTDGAETVHVPACLGAFLAVGRVLRRLASGGSRISHRSPPPRIPPSPAPRGCWVELGYAAARAEVPPASATETAAMIATSPP